MDEETNDILAIVVVDKRQTDFKSPNMEPEGLREALDSLTRAGFTVKE